MKAIVYQKYGEPDDVLEFRDVDIPSVKDDEVLVRVRASSVNPLDWHLMTGTPCIVRPQLGLFGPKRDIPGADVAGMVDAVGKNVTRFQPGDEVFGGETDGRSCAEFVAVSEDMLVLKPGNLTFEQAAAVPVAGLTALQGLRDWGQMQPGAKVLVIGASGGVGTFAVQIAKAFGAEVTGVCSTRNVDTARSIGADRVIDYTREDFTRGRERYDLIFDIAGNRGLSELKRLLEPAGVYVMVGGLKGRWLRPVPRLIRVLLISRFIRQKMVGGRMRSSQEDLQILKGLLEKRRGHSGDRQDLPVDRDSGGYRLSR